MKTKRMLIAALVITLATTGIVFVVTNASQIESVISRIIMMILAGYGVGSLLGDLAMLLFKYRNKSSYQKEISENELDEAKTIILGIDANKFSAKKARMNMEGAFEHNLERILEFIRVSSVQGDDHFTFKNGFPNYKEEMRPILEKLGYTVEVNGEFIKITWGK
jgi:hypothetical protein